MKKLVRPRAVSVSTAPPSTAASAASLGPLGPLGPLGSLGSLGSLGTRPPHSPDALRLRREDLLGMELPLAAQLRRVLPFTAHSLYFPPPANTPDSPQWLPKERTLLLPLPRHGEVLGVFTARGVDGRVVRRLLPTLPALAELCLDNLELERRGRCDALTGLARGNELLARMTREADMVRQRFFGNGEDDMGPLHRVCMGLVVVRCRDWHALAAETSYAFAEKLLVALSCALTHDLPPEALAARTGDDEFAILLSAGSRGACRRLAAALLPRLDAVILPHPVTRRPVRLCCSVGHALYPQDIDVTVLRLPMEEQARAMLHKARLAAMAAQERFDAQLEQNPELASLDAKAGHEARSMPFARLLPEGGIVRRALPLGRAETSLGRLMGASEGLRFAVWNGAAFATAASAQGDTRTPGSLHYKGEIILVDVRENASVADIVHWADPADAPNKGDMLTLLPAGSGAERGTGAASGPQVHDARLLDPSLLHAGLLPLSRTAGTTTAAGTAQRTEPVTDQDTDTATVTDVTLASPQTPSPTPHQTPCLTPSQTTPQTMPQTPHPAPPPLPTVAAHLATALTGTAVPSEATSALLRHGDFARQLGRLCEGRAGFTLVLVRMCATLSANSVPADALSASSDGDSTAYSQRDNMCDSISDESRLALLHLLCRRRWEHTSHGAQPLLSARYGQRSLIFLHRATPADTAAKDLNAPTWFGLYTDLCRDAATEGLDIAVGIAAWPALRFTRADMSECCRKALDLALLLPQPRVGQFGSLALHISADKRYSRGDIFGAVEEYRLALLTDRTNSMAWNSLGVCMAALSRQQEARGYFLKALNGWKRALRQPTPPPFLPADTSLVAEYAATLYNLGTVCQGLGERRTAARYFRLCVDMQPEHSFAHVRLGQLAEEGKRHGKARDYYLRALQLEDQGLGRSGMARRHLAKLAVKAHKTREARDLLHEALVRDPQDAAAMGMLAELSLDGGEDYAMAEMLARNCVSLRGTHAPSWRLLGRALRALGREADADAAEARAETL